ncbi:MAG TPA: hypothetical protein VH639_05555 [Bryobacteraceae bacterium]|jgi:hypothetical protein
MQMSADNVTRLVPPLIALQFAAFGWRINREISVGDAGRKTWLPLADTLNVVSMLSVIAFLVIIPLATDAFEKVGRAVLAAGYLLLSFHPITMAGHYRLFSKLGRSIYAHKGKDYPYATGQELFFFVLSLFLAAGCAWLVVRSP